MALLGVVQKYCDPTQVFLNDKAGELTVGTHKSVTQLFRQNSAFVTREKAAQDSPGLCIAMSRLGEKSNQSKAVASLLAVDSAGSVLCSKNTERNSKCGYSAYGYGPLHPLSPALGFNGEVADQHTQRYGLGLGYREYDTRLMRFFSPDRISPFGAGGLNTYSYCAGDPVNYKDPSGSARDWISYLTFKKKLAGQRDCVKLKVQRFTLEKYHYDKKVEALQNKRSPRNLAQAKRAYKKFEAAKSAVYKSQEQEELYRLKMTKARYPNHSIEAIQQKLAKERIVPKFNPEEYTGTPSRLLTFPSELGRRAQDIRGALMGRLRALATSMTGAKQP
ncbi:RHS repeat-associated core domain-containing protein [Pseudomonas sp. NPDC008258]|uniref:RHS repeat-associated core domain-containing protein n=1 Tax=Pseudomonas sp. NPDC008258 TaxID=3364418 RepID=UPI0036E9CC6A